MLQYYKLYVIKNNQIKYHNLFINDNDFKQNIVHVIGQIFNAFDIQALTDEMIKILEKNNHACFDIFAHVAEIHIFKLTPEMTHIKYNILDELFPPLYTTHVVYNRNEDSDDDDGDLLNVQYPITS